MWYRVDYSYMEKEDNREHHAGRHCFIEADSIEEAQKIIINSRLSDLAKFKIHEVKEIDFVPAFGIVKDRLSGRAKFKTQEVEEIDDRKI